MWSGIRKRFLARHDFFIEQVKARVLDNFKNMEGEANRFAKELYDKMGSTFPEGADMAAAR